MNVLGATTTKPALFLTGTATALRIQTSQLRAPKTRMAAAVIAPMKMFVSIRRTLLAAVKTSLNLFAVFRLVNGVMISKVALFQKTKTVNVTTFVVKILVLSTPTTNANGVLLLLTLEKMVNINSTTSTIVSTNNLINVNAVISRLHSAVSQMKMM